MYRVLTSAVESHGPVVSDNTLERHPLHLLRGWMNTGECSAGSYRLSLTLRHDRNVSLQVYRSSPRFDSSIHNDQSKQVNSMRIPV